jgi:hypothetical protein
MAKLICTVAGVGSARQVSQFTSEFAQQRLTPLVSPHQPGELS